MTTIHYQLTVQELAEVVLRHRPARRLLFWFRVCSAIFGALLLA